MFPIALDLSKINILLIGKGEVFRRRYNQLMEYGVEHISLFGDDVSGSQVAAHDARMVMIAGLPYEKAKIISDSARLAGKLVNVEDMNDLCDFYFTANVNRGDLLIAVSTSGASPTLSRKIRDYIAGIFGAEWTQRTKEIAEFRTNLKEQGKTIPQVLEASDIFLKEKGWLCHPVDGEAVAQDLAQFALDPVQQLCCSQDDKVEV